jgi:hypothetical protein
MLKLTEAVGFCINPADFATREEVTQLGSEQRLVFGGVGMRADEVVEIGRPRHAGETAGKDHFGDALGRV